MSALAALDALVAECPSFHRADDLADYVRHFEEPGEVDAYVRAGALAHHLVALMAARDVEEVGRTFTVADELLAGGDDEARELVTLGVLEPLANIVSHEDVPVTPAQVRSLLGPTATEAWDENQQLWEDAARWRTERPLVTTDDYDGVTDLNLRRYLRSHKRRVGGGALFGTADVVRFQDDVASISAVAPAAARPIPWRWIAVAVALVLVVVVSLVR